MGGNCVISGLLSKCEHFSNPQNVQMKENTQRLNWKLGKSTKFNKKAINFNKS